MVDPVTEIAERGKALGPEDRARLIELLLESFRDTPIAEIEAAWDVEIARRLGEFDRGEVEARDAEAVFARARRIAD